MNLVIYIMISCGCPSAICSSLVYVSWSVILIADKHRVSGSLLCFKCTIMSVISLCIAALYCIIIFDTLKHIITLHQLSPQFYNLSRCCYTSVSLLLHSLLLRVHFTAAFVKKLKH